MGVYTRPDSRFYWITLDGTRPRQRIATKIPIHGPTPAQTKENRAQAEQAYHALMGDVARDRFNLPTTKATRIFAQQAAWYAEHKMSKHEGAVAETWKLARLRAFFDAVALDAITPQLWAEYETERMMKDGVSVNTVGRELAIMKGVLNSAIGEHLDAHRLGSVKRKTVELPAKRTITKDEEPAFLSALQAIDPELADMYLVGVGTLLRQETLIYLQRGEHRGDRLVLPTKKGPHQIPLTGPTVLQRRAAEVLARRMPKAAEGFFFPHWKATFAQYDKPNQPALLLRKKVKRAAKAAGLPWGLARHGIVWHSATRASGATRLMREFQIDIRTVQLIGGWSSLDQMAKYLGLDLDLVKQAMVG